LDEWRKKTDAWMLNLSGKMAGWLVAQLWFVGHERSNKAALINAKPLCQPDFVLHP
jgi:hypothetical protein